MASIINNTRKTNKRPTVVDKNFDDIDDDDVCSNLFSFDKSIYLEIDKVSEFINTSSKSSCTFMHINCRSLSKNFDAISLFLDQLNKPFSVLAVSETWLKPNRIGSVFQIPNYHFISYPRLNKAGGGICLYINKGLQYKLLPDITFIDDNLECIFIEILLSNKRNLIVGCIYRPHNTDILMFNDILNNRILLSKHFCNTNKNIFVLGDFNINLLNNGGHQPTSNFLSNMFSHGLLPTITQPNRITEVTATLYVDLITSSIPKIRVMLVVD